MGDVPSMEERWLTYAEVGELLGISTGAARQLARRHKWPRRTPNEYGAMARVLVPEDRIPQTTSVARTPDSRDTNEYTVPPCAPTQDARMSDGRDTAGEHSLDVRGTDQIAVQVNNQESVLRTTLDVLHTALSTANERADRAEKRTEIAERRIDELHAALGIKDEE